MTLHSLIENVVPRFLRATSPTVSRKIPATPLIRFTEKHGRHHDYRQIGQKGH
jgi:hypothetical protein